MDEMAESEIVLAVAATAAVLSPRVRRLLRKGAVYGLAGVMIAGDTVMSFARGVSQGAQQMATSTESNGASTAPGQPASTGTPEHGAS